MFCEALKSIAAQSRLPQEFCFAFSIDPSLGIGDKDIELLLYILPPAIKKHVFYSSIRLSQFEHYQVLHRNLSQQHNRELIVFLDDDDLLHPQRLEKQEHDFKRDNSAPTETSNIFTTAMQNITHRLNYVILTSNKWSCVQAATMQKDAFATSVTGLTRADERWWEQMLTTDPQEELGCYAVRRETIDHYFKNVYPFYIRSHRDLTGTTDLHFTTWLRQTQKGAVHPEILYMFRLHFCLRDYCWAESPAGFEEADKQESPKLHPPKTSAFTKFAPQNFDQRFIM